MKDVGKFMIVIGILLLCIVVSGCDDSDYDPNSFPLDLRGKYRVEGTVTPVSGNCVEVLPSNSGSVTIAQISSDSFAAEECEFEVGPPCIPETLTGVIDGRQVTVFGDKVFSKEELEEILPGLGLEAAEIHVSVTGTVTDTSQFTLTGQGTVEPGGCVLNATATLTKM